MKTLWIGVAVSLVSPLAAAQSTIYKHVDENGRVTYTNRPMKGAVVLDLEPLSTIPGISPPASVPPVLSPVPLLESPPDTPPSPQPSNTVVRP